MYLYVCIYCVCLHGGFSLVSSPGVCTCAGAIAKVIGQSVAGAQIMDVCTSGDQFILQETDQVFKNKKEIKKGEHALVHCARGMRVSLYHTVCFIVG